MVYKQLKLKYKYIGKHINRYKTERNKQLNTRSTIIYLVRCRKEGVIPNFIKYSTKNIYNIFNAGESIPEKLNKNLDTCINNFHNKILNLLIKQKHEIRKQNTKNAKTTKAQIDSQLTKDDATMLYKSELILEKKQKYEITRRHIKKFNILKEEQKRELDIKENKNWFVNLTNTEIPEKVSWLLSHGKKFAIPQTKQHFPLLTYIADGEECIKTLKEKEAQELARNKFANMIENHVNNYKLTYRDKYTLNAEKQCRQFLEDNKNILILDADKGNVTVALDKFEYEERMGK